MNADSLLALKSRAWPGYGLTLHPCIGLVARLFRAGVPLFPFLLLAIRAQEIERRAAELRTRLADQEQAAQEQRKQTAAEAHRMAERMTAAQAERDQARQEAGKAREEAARLAGQLQAHQEQVAALLARINPAESKPASTRKKGGE